MSVKGFEPLWLNSVNVLPEVSVPIRYQGGFDAIQGDKTKTQTQSDAVQPCLFDFILVNRESEVRRGQQQGEEKTRQKKKGVKSEKPQRARKRSAGWWDQLPPPRIRRCPAMSGQLSLCAGVEAPARAEPSGEAARSRARERELRGARAALL